MKSHRSPSVFLSNILGNTMEWYDFALYGSLAPIIAHLFFPLDNRFTSLMLTFGVYASGFLMRPLGGIMLGRIGDRYGRRTALLISIVVMTVSTMLFGIIPSFAEWGVLSSILLTLLRLIQGVAVGGEFTGSMSYLVETAPKDRRGFFGSFSLVGVLLGILLGTGISLLTSTLMGVDRFESWGWRLPFLLAGVFGYGIWQMRRSLLETPIFLSLRKTKTVSSNPLKECLRREKKPILKGFVITFLNSFAFYILMIYTTTYFHLALEMSLPQSIAFNFFLVGITLILVPLGGLLSDRFGRKKILGISALAFLFLSYPMNLFFASKPPILLFLIGQSLIAFILALYLGPLPSTLAELMPNKVRYTALSIAYNTSLALFGGTAPLIVTYLIEKTGLLTIPGIVLTIAALVSLFDILTMRETYKSKLI